MVCSCLKAFLRLLSEPLVTYTLRPEFIEAVELSLRDPEDAKHRVATLIDRLPAANRDTLAFIILHLKVSTLLRPIECQTSPFSLFHALGRLKIIGMSNGRGKFGQGFRIYSGWSFMPRALPYSGR